MNQTLDLRQSNHPKCQRCDRSARFDIDTDGLCTKIISTRDALPVRCVGEWAYEKIYRLVQYFGIFARGMSKKWNGLNYVEICSGPGRCITRNDRTEMDGTALGVICSPQFPKLRKGIFIDASPRVVDILNQRIKALGASHIAEAIVGDYTDDQGICRILSRLSGSCLNLVFIDPTECDVPFKTIQKIVAHLQNADLLINVALGTDVTRNIVPAILSPSHITSKTKYENFLGVPGFCNQPDVIELANLSDHDDLRRKFIDTYSQSLRGEGYEYTDVRYVKHYYYLLFASRNAKGLEFWNKSCAIAPDNQRELSW
jgi:three-Cys-motif partner protein